MTDTAADQLRRVLQLIPELADDQKHSLDGIADRLGVDRQAVAQGPAEAWPTGSMIPAGSWRECRCTSAATRCRCTPITSSVPCASRSQELGALELGMALVRAERPPEERGGGGSRAGAAGEGAVTDAG